MPVAEVIAEEDVLGYECRFATYVKSTENYDDALVAKQYTYTKDGRRIPGIKVFRNFKMEYWVTKKGYQNHKDKKEWEKETRLDRYTSTQRNKARAIAASLGMPGLKSSVRMLARSPYLYGADIHPSAILKKRYQDKWPDLVYPVASVAVGDIETDVISTGSQAEEIIMITLSFQGKVFTACLKRWIENEANIESRAYEAFEKYLGDVKKERNIDWEFMICDTPAACVNEWAKRAHEWKPDFVTFWNINYDMPKMIKALENEYVNPADVFSDPDIPRDLRYFRYKEGASQKVTQDGTIIPLHPAERWHTVEAPASFYLIDSMCLFCRIRVADGKEQSYALDAIMKKYVDRGKLKFTATDHLSGLDWHKSMQAHFKFEYIIYNVFDCIGVEILDETVKDLRTTFATLIGYSDFGNFSSNPRKLVDDLHFVYRGKGGVIGTTSDDMKEELDKYIIDLNGHVTTLNTELMDYDQGVILFKELPDMTTKTFFHNADIDIAATYPTEEVVFNISKETTWLELSAIQGMNELQRREVGINISGGVANAIEHAMEVHGFPSPQALLQMYLEDKQVVSN